MNTPANPHLYIPLAISWVIGTVLVALHHRLPPRIAVRVTSVVIASLMTSTLVTLFVLTLSFLAHVPGIVAVAALCSIAISGHSESIPIAFGAASSLALLHGCCRVRRILRMWRSETCHQGTRVHIAEVTEPLAFTLPGRARKIVVSTGMLGLLDPDEAAIVFAHEKAHGDHRHDRYLILAMIAAACVPPLAPMCRRLRFGIERWADDVAAERCGSRTKVAETVGKVALAVSPASALGFGNSGALERVTALLGPAVPRPSPLRQAAIWFATSAAVAFGAYQLHHGVGVIASLCQS